MSNIFFALPFQTPIKTNISIEIASIYGLGTSEHITTLIKIPQISLEMFKAAGRLEDSKNLVLSDGEPWY